jgi:hypothetical protein
MASIPITGGAKAQALIHEKTLKAVSDPFSAAAEVTKPGRQTFSSENVIAVIRKLRWSPGPRLGKLGGCAP